MASAWGDSWGDAWGNSWGLRTPIPAPAPAVGGVKPDVEIRITEDTILNTRNMQQLLSIIVPIIARVIDE